ncbi:hypothetical protein [Nonomuraea angiospora]|uniref:hypothetical protein n=1 Tax=Nonomuraea angiospora TaxID=46172 RepID=UPI0029A0999B|nr:hypothetical protein [Nonomuraea angiospora]MDX3101761.1 hypothetical protein [Nonomuraea angiospora]
MSLPAVSVEVMFDNIATPSGNWRINSFDGGTNGVTISTVNSAVGSGSSFSNVFGSPQFTNTQTFGGTGLAAFNPTVGADCHLDWSSVTQSGDVICARLYMYLVSATSGSQRVAVVSGPGGIVSAVWIFNNRTMRVYLGFATSVAAQLNTPVPTGQWVRLELRYTIDPAGNGTAEIWRYDDPNSSIPTEKATSSVLAWPGGKPNTTEFHLQRDAGGYWFLDNIAVADSRIGPVMGTWTNVTLSGKRGITTRRGSSRIESPVIRYDAGTATCYVNNTDRRFDPTNVDGPHGTGARSKVTAMKPIRFRATWNAVTYDLWRGFVDQWDVDHVADVYSEVTVTATDGFKVLRNKRRPAVTPVGAGETTGARVTRILDSAGWPAADRVIATGNSTLQATDLEGDALAELQAAVESEIGELYVDAAGRVVFRGRQAILTDSRSNTVQATFGTAGVFTPARAKLNTDDATLWNEVRAQREGGVEQLLGDSASQAEFQTRTFQASSLMLETDTIVAGYAGWILYVSREPEVRFDSIEIHAHADPDTLFPLVLAREIGDRIRIIRRPSGGGSPIQRDVFIRGISHVTTGATWITTWNLQSATKYGSFLVLNNPTLGKLDQNALAY